MIVMETTIPNINKKIHVNNELTQNKLVTFKLVDITKCRAIHTRKLILPETKNFFL